MAYLTEKVVESIVLKNISLLAPPRAENSPLGHTDYHMHMPVMKKAGGRWEE